MATEQQTPANGEAPVVTFILEGSDGTKIEISHLASKQSKTISKLIKNLGPKNGEDHRLIPLNNITGDTLQMIVAWCEHHKGEPIPVGDNSVTKRVVIPKWDQEFLKIDNEKLFDLMVALSYLEIPQLMNYASQKVANMVEGKSPEEMRVIFEIPTDEEDEKAAKEAEVAAEEPEPSGSN